MQALFQGCTVSCCLFCARTYSAGLFTAPPTGAVCQLRLWKKKKRWLEGERELFIMKTEHQEKLCTAPPCAPSIRRTNNTIARPQRSNHPGRCRAENLIERKESSWALSEASQAGRQSALAGRLHWRAAMVGPRGSPVADKIKGQFNYVLKGFPRLCQHPCGPFHTETACCHRRYY